MAETNEMIFDAVNVETGEVVTGTAKELVEKLGITDVKRIYMYRSTGGLLLKTWRIIYHDPDNINAGDSIHDEWAAVMSKFKAAKQRGSGGHRRHGVHVTSSAVIF